MVNEKLKALAEALKGISEFGNFEIYFESDDLLVIKQELIEGVTVFDKIKESGVKAYLELIIQGIAEKTDDQELKAQIADIINAAE